MARNVRIDAATDARMTMVLGGTPYQARIVEVSETSLLITLDGGASTPPLVRGLELPECVLDIAGVLHGKRVHGLRVEEMEAVAKIDGSDGSAGLRVRLADHGSNARASLWLVVEMLERGVAGPPASAPTADSIPKIPARGVATEEARLARLAFARQISGAELPLMDRTSLRADRLTKNVEAWSHGLVCWARHRAVAADAGPACSFRAYKARDFKGRGASPDAQLCRPPMSPIRGTPRAEDH
jgi:hypothetical protein